MIDWGKVKTEMSLDNMTLTGKEHSIDFGSIFHYLENEIRNFDYWHNPRHWLYQWNFRFSDGTFIQIGEGKKGENKNVRIEFNPNKAYAELVRNIIKRMIYPKVTRLDWAIDYFNVDLSDLKIVDIKRRKQRIFVNSQGKKETHYLGSVNSDKQIRIYNKRLEREEKEKKEKKEEEEEQKQEEKEENHWWRVESQTRDFTIEKDAELLSLDDEGKPIIIKATKKEDSLLMNPFTFYFEEKREEVMAGDGWDKLKIQEKAMLFYLEHFPEERLKLSYNSRKKYDGKRFFYGYELIPCEFQPYYIYENKKQAVAEELEYWLKPAIDNGLFILGIGYAN